MLEIPESINIAEQLNRTIRGKVIRTVKANASPHKFAFYFGDPELYQDLLAGKMIGESLPMAGFVEIKADDARILFNDGVNIRYYQEGEQIPEKHQLRIEFSDGSSIVCTISMYGGLWAYQEGENENEYYLTAKSRPNPLSDQFDREYFSKLMDSAKPSMSAKAFLATEQRIPGLGNGVLQDILFNAGIHPKSKLEKLTEEDQVKLFLSIKNTLATMTKQGGRDTEKNLFGNEGQYVTKMSKKTLSEPCPLCGGAIIREAYMGGNVYFCPTCQPLKK